MIIHISTSPLDRIIFDILKSDFCDIGYRPDRELVDEPIMSKTPSSLHRMRLASHPSTCNQDTRLNRFYYPMLLLMIYFS